MEISPGADITRPALSAVPLITTNRIPTRTADAPYAENVKRIPHPENICRMKDTVRTVMLSSAGITSSVLSAGTLITMSPILS